MMREGTSYHETKTFDRRPAATTWIKKHEKELAKPGALDELNVSEPLLSKAIERYTEETVRDIGRTKAQVPRTITSYPIADLPCSTIKSKDISDRDLASAVARHKRMFFPEKTADGTPLDYEDAVHGNLQLAPNGEARTALAADYAHMVDDGLLLEDAERFDDLIEHCASIAERANRLANNQHIDSPTR